MRKTILIEEFNDWLDTFDDTEIGGSSVTIAEGVSFSVQLFARPSDVSSVEVKSD